MAIVVESVATGAWAGVTSGSDLSISKPTGLAEGDLMVAIVGMNDSDNTPFDMEALTNGGWTDYVIKKSVSGGDQRYGIAVSYKVATSTDASTSTFAFRNNSGESVGMGGVLLRISGHGVTASIQNTSDDDTFDTTPTYTPGLTPTYANSLLIFCAGGTYTVASSTTTSAYAIATSNPSWTEQADISGDLSGFFGSGNTGTGPWLAVATATRPETTATGDFSCAFSSSVSNSVGVLVAVAPQSDASINADVITVNAIINEPSVTGGANVTADVVTVNATTNDPVVTSAAPDWRNQDKNTVAITNQAKS